MRHPSGIAALRSLQPLLDSPCLPFVQIEVVVDRFIDNVAPRRLGIGCDGIKLCLFVRWNGQAHTSSVAGHDFSPIRSWPSYPIQKSGKEVTSLSPPPLRTVLAAFTAHGSSKPVTPSLFCFCEPADDSTNVLPRGLRLRPPRPETSG